MNVIRSGLVVDSAIRYVEVPGYPAPHSPYTHAVVANGLVLQEMNEAYAEFFTGAKPARSMARFGADTPGVFLAIDAIALA